MTIRFFLSASLIALLIGGLSLAGVITQLDPEQAGTVGFILFFLSLFTAVASAASLVGYGLRRILMRRQFPAYTARTSLRQALIVGVFVVLVFFLQLLRLYRWWLALAIIALLVCVEVVFLSYGRSNQRHFEYESKSHKN